MYNLFLAGILLCLFVLPLSADAQDAGDRQKLLGVWKGYVVDGAGENPDRGPLHLQLTITADKISAINLQDGNQSMGEGAYQLDPAKKLPQLDATGVVLPGKRSRTFLGIYEIKGDTLRWCVDNRQTGRPTEFRSAKGFYLLVLRRQKK